MDIRKPQSLLTLLVESFKLINRAFSTLLVFMIVGAVSIIGLGLGLSLLLPTQVVSWLVSAYSTFLAVVLYKLLASRAENDFMSLSDIAITSFKPTLYWLVLTVAFAFIGKAVGFVTGLSGGFLFALLGAKMVKILWIGVPLVLAWIVLWTRFIGIIPAIALRDQNPIEAFVYSWQITRGHFFYALGSQLIMCLVPTLYLGLTLYALYTTIPLYFADSFDLVHLSGPWIAVLAVLGIIVWLVGFAMLAFRILVFLNLDYRLNSVDVSADLPQDQMITNQAATEMDAQAQGLGLSQASVKTQNAEDTFSQHLDQVYQPQQTDIVQQTEEDRMPTIVFDDEMAQQMQDRARLEQETRAKNPDDKNDNSSPIKMSK